MASLRYVVADVFTDTALTGNQLAVFTDGRDADDGTMQKLAKEMNFSETVFVVPPEGDGHVRIRIFTPSRELPFADRSQVVRPRVSTTAIGAPGNGARAAIASVVARSAAWTSRPP